PNPMEPGGFRVRPARRSDADGMSALLKELGYPEGVDASTLHWVISHPEIEIFVAVDPQDRVVGMLSLSHRPQLRLRGRIASVDELVVTPAWRKKGTARALLRRAAARAKTLGVKRLELRTHGPAKDPGLANFAQACGFMPSGSDVFST